MSDVPRHGLSSRINRLFEDRHQIAVICPCGWVSEWVDFEPSPRAAKATVQGQHDDHILATKGDADQLVVHILSQEGQPYGSERRCCNNCGIMIWGASAPVYVDNWIDWRESPYNCGKK